MSRRVLTASSIDEILAQGQRELILAPGDVITPLARDKARDRGLELVRADSPAAAPHGDEDADGPAAVRRAVIAVLGAEPEGLDAAIDRVMGRR